MATAYLANEWKFGVNQPSGPAKAGRASEPKGSIPGLRCSDCGACYHTDVEAWYRAYSRRLLRLVRAWGYGTSNDAEDIVQDAFTDLTKQFGQVDNPAGWLITVASRRRAGILRELEQLAAGDISDYIGLPPTRMRWTSLTRLPDIDTAQTVREVLRTLPQLPHRQRAAVYLYHVEGWTHAEIADLLGCAIATVAVHVHRGTTFLQGLDVVCVGKQNRASLPAMVDRPSLAVGRLLDDFRYFPYLPSYERQRPLWVWCGCWQGIPQRWCHDMKQPHPSETHPLRRPDRPHLFGF